MVNEKIQAVIEENYCYLQLTVAIWKQGFMLPDLLDIQQNLEIFISF